MRVLISAAETSSDLHGARVLKSLHKQLQKDGRALDAFGLGGPRLAEGGMHILLPSSRLLAMGTSEIISKLPSIWKARRLILDEVDRSKPDFAVLIDYPDFHFRLARDLRARGIPLYYFIPPKVWAWRQGRVRLLRKYFEELFLIFPFEATFYANQNIRATFVGNPMADHLPAPFKMEEARSRLGLSVGSEDRVIALLPGSRPNEISRNLPLGLRSLVLAHQRMKASNPWKVLIPIPDMFSVAEVQKAAPVDSRLNCQFFQGKSHEVLCAADSGLVKSGTSTLEAAYCGLPHIAFYKASPLTEFIFDRILSYQGPVALSNLLSNWKPGESYRFKEVIAGAASVERLASAWMDLVGDARSRDLAERGIEEVRANLAMEQSPSDTVANILIERCRAREASP